MKLKLFVIITIIISWNSVEGGCPPLNHKPEIRLTCADPATGADIPCTSEVPFETIARYECAPHYAPPIGDSEGGRMNCQRSGIWNRQSKYEEFNCKLECGKPTAAVSGLSTVVVFGEVATRENFPWHVAIFRSDGPRTAFRYFCGGSLSSPSNKGFLVITAAHCATSKQRTSRIRPLEDFRVILGPVSSDFQTNLNTNGTQVFTVKAAKIHPDYNYDTIQNDVAIMKLREPIKISDYVSPICFPTSDMANMQIQGEGLIAGFGVDQSTKISATLNFARLPVTENHICNYALGKELTSIEFCAGYQTGSSICSGDSGGGFAFMDDLTKHYYIQGIASNVDRRPLQDLKFCQNYNTFTRVSSYVDWVQDQLDEFFADDDVQEYANKPPRPSKPVNPSSSVSNEEFLVTVYKNIDDMDSYVQWRMKNCSSVPENWNNNGRYWIDIHGKCLQFFEGIYCSGRSLQLKSTQTSSIFEWSFPTYRIKSVSQCSEESIQISTPRPISNGNVNGNGYEKVGIQRHNLYRTKHGVAPLTLSENLNTAATKYAKQLLNKSKLEPSGSGGENLYEINGSSDSFTFIASLAVDAWYKSIDNYNWNFPFATAFSQLVWKATKEIGIGMARSGRRTIVVAKYTPPGNIYFAGSGDRAKYFRENVLPARK